MAIPLRGGRLKNFIDIETNTPGSVSDIGEPIESWSTWKSDIPAEVTEFPAREIFNNETGQRYSETNTEFLVRHSEVEGMATTARVLFEGQRYDIKNVIVDRQDRRWVKIRAVLFDGVV